MNDDIRIAETQLQVAGVRTDDDVKKALQPLYDIFADQGMGQATFEITDAPTATLVIKHQESASVDRVAVAAALSSAGDYRLVD